MSQTELFLVALVFVVLLAGLTIDGGNHNQ